MKMALCPARTCVLWRLASEVVAGETIYTFQVLYAILASRTLRCTRKLVCFVRSSPRGPRSACMYETSPTEVAMFTPEVISRKTFRRLTKEKTTRTREIEKMKNCLNFARLEENVSIPVSWEGKTEHSMCAGNCTDSDRDRFSAKGVLCTEMASHGTDTVSYGSSGNKRLPGLCSVFPYFQYVSAYIART